MIEDAPRSRTIDALFIELQGLFGSRLQSLVAYGARGAGGHGSAERLAGGGGGDSTDRLHTLAVVESVSAADLRGCAALAPIWTRRRLATPLVMTADELARSLDAFPLELHEILTHHLVVAGRDPFVGLSVKPEDLRRACEVQTRSHVVHLRQGHLESGGHPPAVARLILASASPFRVLVTHVAQLEGTEPDPPDRLTRHLETAAGLPAEIVTQVLGVAASGTLGAADAEALFPDYMDAVERLARYVDGWRG